MIGYVYGESACLRSQPSLVTKTSDELDNTLQPGVDFGLKVASPVGNLVGQIFFGWLADLVGRKRMCKCQRSIRYT
jgi:PHS family inorganic phosphate transporter-like MFS transporter